MSEILLNPPPAALGAVNAIVSGRARHYEVERFRGPLSVKSVTSGSATWETAAGRFELVPGSLLIVNDGETYSMGIDSLHAVETFTVFFARGFVEDARRAAVTGSDALLDADGAAAFEFFEPLRHDAALLRAMRTARGREEAAFVALAEVLVATQCDVAVRVTGLPALRSTTRAELLRRLGKATEFIHGNLSEPLGLERIAAAASLSPFHFHRIFTAFHGLTPHAYISRLRLSRAAVLLRAAGRPVVDIAGECGFSSVTSFTSLFRRTFGVPPARFRKIGEAEGGAAQ
ncbi:MAG TPA: AraC family transcriptional regulator [Thermoanaerobaculia bacterium]|nr:AraC family transcriptional regulator [Thermoanaerobaculia bacterium]